MNLAHMTGVKSPTGGINMRDIQRIGFLRRGFLQGTAITGLAALTSAQTLAAEVVDVATRKYFCLLASHNKS
jgi:hypothetical protein